MTERTDQTIKVLRSELDGLGALVRKLTADDLARVSGASEWDVSQVLSHLGSGAEINLAALNGALDDSGPPSFEAIKGIWARWDAMSRTDRAEGFAVANEALVSRFENLEPQVRNELRIALWFPSEPLDVAGLGAMRLSEFALHRWDVEVAFDPSATLTPEAVELLVDRVAGLVGFAGKPGEREATVAVRVTSPERSLGLRIGEAVAVADDPASPDAVLTAPAEWWLRLVSGRHAPAHTPAGVELTGDSLTLDDLRRTFPGF
ncbi:maleylpyruvate isomerase family mycothiol-dependent enzyme [Sphaerisporangium sp. TRM90804]|uniref:maleylpyruvate isomerase family mycothiol-dependent enzyme n=1 Tax=Sphaerisporangium sp. TRM90804 TaxID=3031113 RepID=UPI002449046C|nr:maleylpyruvate isomerase family mycothiol-dependent enzyme [Sphaerisporangium sp. TRM90804]MDH2426566.1 maleylpyruvate isomerase family mycothiol-dependent enzyme [Sphaerisporangium sp. TRM90804]